MANVITKHLIFISQISSAKKHSANDPKLMSFRDRLSPAEVDLQMLLVIVQFSQRIVQAKFTV